MNSRTWTKADVCLTVANILGVIAIVMIAAVIGTDRWVIFTVDRASLSTGLRNTSSTGESALYYHTRHRGMFRECYPGTDTMFLDTAENVVDKNCFMIKLVDNIAGASDKYKQKVGLYTGFVVMFLVGEVVLIVAYIIGLFLCIGKMHSHAWYAAMLSFFAAFLLTLGVALFHGSLHVEREQVKDTLQGRQLFYQQWPSELKSASTMEYGESYKVAWAGICLVVITCCLYILAARLIPNPKRELKKALGRENQAYGYPQQHQPVMYPTEQPMVYYVA